MVQTTEVLPENLGEVLGQVLNVEASDQSFLAIDTETAWSDPHTDHLKLVQFAGQGTPVYVAQPQSFQGQLVSLLPLFQSSHLKILQNGKFDFQFLQTARIRVVGPFFDTMLASRVLCCGQATKHDLGSLALRHLGITLDKSLQQSFRNDEPLSAAQIDYGAADVAVLNPLRLNLEMQLTVARLNHVAQLEFRLMPLLAQMEFVGVGVDQGKLGTFCQQLQQTVESLDQRVRSHLPSDSLTSLFEDKPVANINLNSPRALLKAFESLGIHAESTQTDTLIPLAEKHQVVAALLRYRQAEKALRTFQKKLLGAIHPRTGSLHGSYTQCDRDSGSLSPSRTGVEELQALGYFPLDCLVARPGYRLIRIHYEGLAMRVLANLSRDANLMLCYQDGAEFHRQNRAVQSVEMFEDEYADTVAAVARGVGIHNLSGVRLQRFAYHNHGVLLSKKKAASMRADFLNRFPDVEQYHIELREHGRKSISNLTGRRCQWQYPPSPSVLCQFLVYSVCSDILKQAVCDLGQMLGDGGGQVLLKLDNQLIVEVNLAGNEVGEVCRVLRKSAQFVIGAVPIAVNWQIVGEQR